MHFAYPKQATFAKAKINRLTPIKRTERTLLEIKVSNTAPIIAKLIDCPRTLIVPNVPEATLRWFFSTDLMTKLLLG